MEVFDLQIQSLAAQKLDISDDHTYAGIPKRELLLTRALRTLLARARVTNLCG